MEVLEYIVNYAFLILLGLILVFIFFKAGHEQRRVQKILAHFKGASSFRRGKVAIKYSWVQFFLVRMSSSGAYGAGGSYPQLMLPLENSLQFDIGNTAAQKFLYLLKVPEPSEIVKVGTSEIFIHSKNAADVQRLSESFQKDPLLAAAVAQLFKNELSFLRVRKETDIDLKFNLEHQLILRYTGLPGSIYKEPSLLEPYLQSLVVLKPVIEGLAKSKP